MSVLFLGDSVWVKTEAAYGTVKELDVGPDKDRVMVQIDGDEFFGPVALPYRVLRPLR